MGFLCACQGGILGRPRPVSGTVNGEHRLWEERDVNRFSHVGVLVFACATAVAGPLNPPAGPVTSTGKTLTEVEPRIVLSQANTPGDANSVFRIAKPGSYYLSGNLSVPAGQRGIEIASPGVHIDLCGFEIAGLASSLEGISVDTGNLTSLSVRNGQVRQMGGTGVNFNTPNLSGFIVENVTSRDNGGVGILTGPGAIVRGCAALGNSSDGIRVGANSIVQGCIASGQTGAGDGIETGEECVVVACVANGNQTLGIRAGVGSVVSACTASDNVNVGIGGNSDCRFVDCVSSRNQSHGFSLSSRSLIQGCVANQNVGHGIFATSANRIEGNLCQGNGAGTGTGSGIRTTASDNLIHSNQCLGNDIGIDVAVSGSLITGNRCSGNGTSYSIAAGNSIAPIVQAGTNAVAINGNFAAGTLGSSDPHMNVTY